MVEWTAAREASGGSCWWIILNLANASAGGQWYSHTFFFVVNIQIFVESNQGCRCRTIVVNNICGLDGTGDQQDGWSALSAKWTH